MRQSNIELLRIICMFMIVLGHLFFHYEKGIGDYPMKVMNYNLLYPILMMHVDVFVLISGYFGLTLKTKRIFNLWLQCVFYIVLFTFVAYAFSVHAIKYDAIVFPFTRSGLWYLKVYVMLMLLSPMLNSIIDRVNDTNKWNNLLIVTFVFNFYLSWLHHVEGIYAQGFDICNFCCLYIFGRYIAYHGEKYPTKVFIILFSLCSVAKVLLSYLSVDFPIFDKYLSSNLYNSPLNVFSAIGIFVLFLRWRREWYSKTINKIASSCLSVYLITEISYVRNYLTEGVGRIYNFMLGSDMLCIYPLVVFFFLLLVYSICISLDKIRVYLFKFVI